MQGPLLLQPGLGAPAVVPKALCRPAPCSSLALCVHQRSHQGHRRRYVPSIWATAQPEARSRRAQHYSKSQLNTQLNQEWPINSEGPTNASQNPSRSTPTPPGGPEGQEASPRRPSVAASYEQQLMHLQQILTPETVTELAASLPPDELENLQRVLADIKQLKASQQQRGPDAGSASSISSTIPQRAPVGMQPQQEQQTSSSRLPPPPASETLRASPMPNRARTAAAQLAEQQQRAASWQQRESLPGDFYRYMQEHVFVGAGDAEMETIIEVMGREHLDRLASVYDEMLHLESQPFETVAQKYNELYQRMEALVMEAMSSPSSTASTGSQEASAAVGGAGGSMGGRLPGSSLGVVRERRRRKMSQPRAGSQASQRGRAVEPQVSQAEEAQMEQWVDEWVVPNAREKEGGRVADAGRQQAAQQQQQLQGRQAAQAAGSGSQAAPAAGGSGAGQAAQSQPARGFLQRSSAPGTGGAGQGAPGASAPRPRAGRGALFPRPAPPPQQQ